MGIMLFEERIGCLEPNPPAQAIEYIENLVGYFRLLSPLLYGVPVYKVFPTKQWKEFMSYLDNVGRLGEIFVKRKMDVLKKQMEEGVQKDEETSKLMTYLLTHQSLTLEEATSSTVSLFGGGLPTMSKTMRWVLYCLAKNPEVQEQVYEDISKVVEMNEPITPQILEQLKHVKACLKETLRIFPVAFATSRVLEKDIEVCGYHLPAGTRVLGNVYSMGRNSGLFSDPLEFRPQRWIGNRPDNRYKSLYNLQWGHGARMCIGRRIAEQQIYILLTKIILNFRLEYHHEDVQPILDVVLSPDRPVLIKFLPRHQQN